MSPDGSGVAVLSGDGEPLILVDLAQMRVTAARTVTRPQSLLRRLGLLPRDAYAKMEEGQHRSLAFAPDGRRLYAFGQEMSIDSANEPHVRGLDLLYIDLDSATVTAKALAGQHIARVMPAPDGSALYVLGPTAASARTWNLRRLDPSSLKVTARRSLDSYQLLLFLASSDS